MVAERKPKLKVRSLSSSTNRYAANSSLAGPSPDHARAALHFFSSMVRSRTSTAKQQAPHDPKVAILASEYPPN